MIKKTFGVGIDSDKSAVNNKKLTQYINLKLAAIGQPFLKDEKSAPFLDIASPLLNTFKEQSRLLSEHQSPVNSRIQKFIDGYLSEVPGEKNVTLPTGTLDLDRHGLARMMSLPPTSNKYETDIVSSYRVAQGIVHNPKSDKRTTKGVFHVVEGGLPIADDKKAVPKQAFAKLLEAALNPPKDLMQLPFTADQEDKAELFVSLLLRPIVVPEVPGVIKEKCMEVRFFAPGNLVSNLDFVESIFGNAGDPNLPENDAALDPESWTGTTGCVILATHMIYLKKKDLGLPHYDDATERQRRDGMCWKDENELYNDGGAFKVTCRDENGVVVTLIADNYFGYCKKEVKTMIGYSSNIYGISEEEHAGGALAFPGYDLGERFTLPASLPSNGQTFKDMVAMYPEFMEEKKDGYAVDKNHSNVIYVPEDADFNLFEQRVRWTLNGDAKEIKLLPQNYYIYPSGYRVQMRKRLNGSHWHLTGAVGEGTFCHKPCTVSGGGKSEISKSISDAMIQGPVYVSALEEDLNMVEEILEKDYSNRFTVPADYSKNPPRSVLDNGRSLGSLIKLLTVSEEYTDEYNDWLKSVPQRIKDLVYIVKRRYHTEWGEDWKSYFSVDRINGQEGNELRFADRKLLTNYLRVGHDTEGSWRTFQVRQDYYPAQKVQTEDDISASIVLASDQLSNLNPDYKEESVKILTNCESRLFQRPDDCVIKGYDKQAEKDLTSPNAFFSNYEPLSRKVVKEIKDDTIGFDLYTQPVKDRINEFLASDRAEYLVVPSEPRLVDGVPTANPRYLQTRPDLENPIDRYLAETCTRIYRKIPADKPLFLPVNSVLPGRRNNPADEKKNVPPLAIYNPIHHQELPELFIDYICSVTGKSPSTTGFGSEGALTKGPFNSLLVASDLNNAFLAHALTGAEPFISAAGYVGPKYKVEHDVSLLMPEVISRMSVKERDPKFLIENGYLDKVEDIVHNGETVEASLLGYRINKKFVNHFMGRIFSSPEQVFTEDMLKPELQDLDTFVASMKNLSITQVRVAEGLLRDGTVENLCPPLKALINIMVKGNYKGMDRNSPEFRNMFTREYVINSDWYKERLMNKQQKEIQYWKDNIAYLNDLMSNDNFQQTAKSLNLDAQLENSKAKLANAKSIDYLNSLNGTIGADTLKPIK